MTVQVAAHPSVPPDASHHMVLIWNPAAGRRRAVAVRQVLEALAGFGIRPQLAETTHPGHATALARDAATSGAGLVVAAGGDGTVAEVANGLCAGITAGGPAGHTALGIVPLGTANVLAHELDLPFAPAAVAAALAQGRTRPVWPGIAEGPAGTRLFVQMLGVGFDAQVVHRLSLRLKRAVGRGAYVWQALREAARGPHLPVRLLLDEVPCEAAAAVVTKGRLYAGRYLLAPDASPAEPGFAVALFGRGGPLGTLMYSAALPLNLLPRAPGLRLVRAARVEIQGEAVPVQADGDPAGRTPVLVRDAPAPIPVVVAG